MITWRATTVNKGPTCTDRGPSVQVQFPHLKIFTLTTNYYGKWQQVIIFESSQSRVNTVNRLLLILFYLNSHSADRTIHVIEAYLNFKIRKMVFHCSTVDNNATIITPWWSAVTVN